MNVKGVQPIFLMSDRVLNKISKSSVDRPNSVLIKTGLHGSTRTNLNPLHSVTVRKIASTADRCSIFHLQLNFTPYSLSLFARPVDPPSPRRMHISNVLAHQERPLLPRDLELVSSSFTRWPVVVIHTCHRGVVRSARFVVRDGEDLFEVNPGNR